MTTQTSGLVDLVDMAERLERRDISCNELTATTLGHVARLNPLLNAYITVTNAANRRPRAMSMSATFP